MSSQSPPESVPAAPTAPTVSAAAWEPGPDTRVFVGPTLNDAVASARFELGRQVEIRSARKVRQGMRARTRFEVLAVIPAEPDLAVAEIDTDAAGSPLDLFPSARASVIPAQGSAPPLPPLADPSEAVAATLAAMMADADDLEAGIASSGDSDFAADLARQISARRLDPVFRAAMPPTTGRSRAATRDLPSDSEDALDQADAAAENVDTEEAPDPTFAARVRAALGRVALEPEPEPTVGAGPHPDVDMLDPENPGGSPAAEVDYPEPVFPRPRASESSRGLPDLATAGAPPGSLPQSTPSVAAPVESPAVQPWQARALDHPSDSPVSRMSPRSRQQQADAKPEVAKRVFRTSPPPANTAMADVIAELASEVAAAAETVSPVAPVTPVAPASESPADRRRRMARTRPASARPAAATPPAAPVRDASVTPSATLVPAATEARPAPVRAVARPVVEPDDDVAAAPRPVSPRVRAAKPTLELVASDADETPATLAGWSRVTLTRLGLPREVMNKLPSLDPVDDLGWLRALRMAIEAVVKPAQADADAGARAVVNGTGAASAVIILRAAIAGATPGTLTMDGRTVQASPTELALAVRSCVVS